MDWLEHFEGVVDPRTPYHAFKHSLPEVLCIALVAVLCGAESFVEIEQYGQAKVDWLRERLGLELPHGIPSHDTFGRLFARLDPDSLEGVFVAWTRQLMTETGGQVLAIDGKTLRRSFDTATGQSALHLVSVWASHSRLVLEQQLVDSKSNEMTAVPTLLEALDLTDCVVTVDALNSQKNIAAQIKSRGGDYVLALKENHLHLYEDVRDYFEWCRKQPGGMTKLTDDSTVDQSWGHGRQEIRRCYCLQATPEDWPQALKAWAGVSSLILVERERIERTPGGTPPTVRDSGSVTRPFYLSSLAPDAKRLLSSIRAHWGVENSLHWVLDVAFDEDASRVRLDHAPHNFATLRKLALNLLRQDTKTKCGLKARRHKAGWDNNYLLSILAGP